VAEGLLESSDRFVNSERAEVRLDIGVPPLSAELMHRNDRTTLVNPRLRRDGAHQDDATDRIGRRKRSAIKRTVAPSAITAPYFIALPTAHGRAGPHSIAPWLRRS
jgi:hypothetical protein